MNAGSPVRRTTHRDTEVSKRVREHRLAKGMSQTELGRAIGVTFQQVQKYENGMNRIGAGRLSRIAAALEIPVAALFGSGRRQHHIPSPADDLTVEGADKLLRAFQRIADRDSRLALLQITRHLAKT